MQIKHFGNGQYRIRYNQSRDELAYIYFTRRDEAFARVGDYVARYSGMGIVRLEQWNGEMWIV